MTHEKVGLLQHVPGIEEAATLADLEVQVRAGGVTGGAAGADGRAFDHRLAAGGVPGAQVGVDGDVAVAVVDGDHVAVAAADGAGIDDRAGIGSVDAVALVALRVDGGMAVPVVVAGDLARVGGRPAEGA